MAKADLWAITDAEERKRGERTGLDTLLSPGYLLSVERQRFHKPLPDH